MNLRETGREIVELVNLTDFCERDYEPSGLKAGNS
jgi:hypothetical protein